MYSVKGIKDYWKGMDLSLPIVLGWRGEDATVNHAIRQKAK